VLGLVQSFLKQYSTETAAWKAVSTLRLDINQQTLRPEGQPETFEQLANHYRMVELDLEKESERKVRQTKQTVQFHDILYTLSLEILYTSAHAEVGRRCHGRRWKFGNSVLSL
jgi:hypothetical protein